jgi:Beta-lactamase class D
MGNTHASEVVRQDYSNYFNGFEGSFVLYDESQDNYIVYNETQSIKEITPCSTFKIYNSLIGLEVGAIDREDTKTFVKWDGTKYSIDSWNRDHTLSSATKNSVVWYYKLVARRIGPEKMKAYLDQFDYGNKDISGGITNFWLQSSLKISAQEQVDLLYRMFSGQLPVAAENVDIIKTNILQSRGDGIVYYGKTGAGYKDGKWITGWWVGCIEKEGHRYFFATNIEGVDAANGVKARQITENILRHLDILQ